MSHAFDALAQDIRYALRALKNSPTFAAVAILSLALGIGANTAIFSFVDAVMLKYLPVEQPQELLQVTMGEHGNTSFTNPQWEQLRDHQDVFSGAFAWSPQRFNLAAGGEVRYSQSLMTSGDFFRTLGVRTVLGRAYTPADDKRGCPGVAVISYDFWQGHYSGDGAIVGKQIFLDRHPFEILGVIQPGFHGIEVGLNFDIATPMCAEAILRGPDSILDERHAWWLRVMGRPKIGLGAKQVTARLRTLAPQIFQATLPPDWGPEDQKDYLRRTFGTQPAAHGLGYFRNEYGAALITLMVVVGMVLLIACANIANLLLARASMRQREIAIRLAIGASRGRLVRQLLTESVLLSLIGAALGMLLANWGSSLLVRYLSSHDNPVFLDLKLNLRLLGFTAAVAVATGILFGTAPAWRATRVPLNAAMKENARGLTGPRSRLGLGKVLVVSQVGLSLVLLISAGLLAASFWKLITVDTGFERDNVLTVGVDSPGGRTPKDRLSAQYDQVLELVRALPGVHSAGRAMITPISGSMWNDEIQIDAYTPKSREDAVVYFNRISPKFLETLGTPILAGRDFDPHDTAVSMPVALINETLAKKFFRGVNPVGKYMRLTGSKPGEMIPTQIIGLVKDAKYAELREAILATAYVPMTQDKEPRGFTTFVIRTAGQASGLISAVKAAFASTNRDLNLEFGSLAVQVNESLNRERLLATLSGFFGALAVLLSAIGLYGVMSYTVARRRNEIGIRMALGAERGSILWMVLREVLLLVGCGMAIGYVAASAGTRWLASMLYGLSPGDPATLSVAGVILLLAAALAGYLPAHRAARLDPMTTLREE